MAENIDSIGGVLIASALGLLVLSWIGLVIAGRSARKPGRSATLLGNERGVLWGVVVIAALAILAATVAIFCV